MKCSDGLACHGWAFTATALYAAAMIALGFAPNVNTRVRLLHLSFAAVSAVLCIALSLPLLGINSRYLSNVGHAGVVSQFVAHGIFCIVAAVVSNVVSMGDERNGGRAGSPRQSTLFPAVHHLARGILFLAHMRFGELDGAAANTDSILPVLIAYDLAIGAHLIVFGCRAAPVYAAAHAFDALLYAGVASRLRPRPEDRLVKTRYGSVRVRIYGNEAWSPSKATVVLIPDGPAVAENCEDAAIAVMAAFACPVVSMDMPGFGMSRPSPLYNHSFEAGADAIDDVLQSLGIRRALLNCSCVNGFYALALASRPNTKVAGLVLAQTPDIASMEAWAVWTIPTPVKIPFVGQLVTFFTRKKLGAKWFRIAIPKATPNRDTVLASWTAHADAVSARGGCNCLAGVVQGSMSSTTDSLYKVPGSIPVSCVWGASDITHRRTNPKSIVNIVPHATVRVVEPPVVAGHAPTLEIPQLLVDALAPMLA